MTTQIKWEVNQGINAGEAVIAGTHPAHGDCLYVVTPSGDCDLSDNDTEGDFGGDGWPSPPANLIAEATALANGNPGAGV